MLSFILDTLHEDLNRVMEKPYCELAEKESNESDAEASQRWWQNHLKRENSIIVDMFHGQFKSVITCPECERISITFDPFMYLGLPIPSETCKIKFKFFPLMPEYEFHDLEINLTDTTNIRDLKHFICENFKVKSIEYLDALRIKDFMFKQILKDGVLVKQVYEISEEVIFYELQNNAGYNFGMNTFYITPAEFIQESSFLFFKNSVQNALFYAKPFTLEKGKNVGDLYLEVFKFYRRLLDDYHNHEYKNFKSNCSNQEFVEKEFDFYINKKEAIKLHFINNIPESDSIFSSKVSCEFCGDKCQFCKLPILKQKIPLHKLYDGLRIERKLVLYAEISTKMKPNILLLYNKIPVTKNLMEKKKGSINIYDCIEDFSKEERLQKENAWFCPKCKKHQEALKRLEIYRPPNILIVQFKRFKIKSTGVVMGFLQNKKNEAFIDFPINNLDITKYVVGNNKENHIYELYAISQHFGGLSSGHYTALAKNANSWVEFDDESVSKVNIKEIVSSSAYILFYKRKAS